MLQAKIASRANELSRQIYASLPFEYRVARLLIKLRIASFMELSYGALLYAEFIKAGVPDMPMISGEPAELWRDKIIRRGPGILPRGYGGKFGRELWALSKKILGKYGSDDNVAEVMQNSMAELLGSNARIKIKGYPLKQAQSWVKTLIARRSKDLLRKLKRERTVPTTYMSDDDEEMHIQLIDESALRQFVQELGPTGRRTLHKELQKVDPGNPNRAWEWLQAEAEGFSGKELAGMWGVTPSAVSQWVTRYRPRIQDAFRSITQ